MSKKVGRPEKIDPTIIKKIADAVRAGNYIETAAAYAGIHKDTLYQWLKKGAREESGIYREFSDAIKEALAYSEMEDGKTIKRQSRKNWQAAAWRLERRFPQRWGKKETLSADFSVSGEVTKNEQQHITHEININDPESIELLRALWRRSKALEGTSE